MTVKDFLALEGHAYGMKATMEDILEVLEPEELEERVCGVYGCPRLPHVFHSKCVS